MKSKDFNINGLADGIRDMAPNVEGLVIRIEDKIDLFIDKQVMLACSRYGDETCFNYITSYKVSTPLSTNQYVELVDSEAKYGQVDIKRI